MPRKMIILLLFLLPALSVPALVQAQARAPVESVLPARRGPIRVLLEHREPLGLSAEQVSRLQAIRARTDERNRPLVERFLEIRRKWQRERPTNWRALSSEQRTEARERFQRGIREETRELREQIQRNEREAMLEVREVLTEAQKAKVRRFLRDGRPGRGPGAPSRGQ